jgi:hypothetical protein
MRLIFILIACVHVFTPYIHAQKKVNRQYFINLLNEGEYAKVFDSATRLRIEVYGKNAIVDYFIAKSLCLDGHPKSSAECFNRIIKNFKLSGVKKTFIQQEITTCTVVTDQQEAPSAAAPDFSYINNVTLPESSVGGKMGRVYDCFSKNQTINLSSMVSQQELEARLFAVNNKKAAVKKISGLLNDRYKTDTGGRYVFVTLKKSPLDSVAYTAAKLEEAYRFFVTYYGLRAPDKLLTVYILPNQQALRQTAAIVHGIQLPDPNIGYSNLSDLSLLGLGDTKHLGTLYHELFHLIIRTDIGDVPPFIDEGIASLYAVSRWQNGKLIGDYRPWRLDELKEASYARDPFLKIPPLDKLISYGWDEFDGQETKNVCQVAVNYALSNFLMIYLQEKNLLQELVTAFKNRPFIAGDTARDSTNLQLFEAAVKDSIKNFTVKFEEWFTKAYQFNLYQQGTSSATVAASIPMMFENARILLAETDEKVFKHNNKPVYRQLETELMTIETDYRNVAAGNQENSNNISNAVMQQTVPADKETVKRKDIRDRLEAFDKKLRKLIFDQQPKTAN